MYSGICSCIGVCSCIMNTVCVCVCVCVRKCIRYNMPCNTTTTSLAE